MTIANAVLSRVNELRSLRPAPPARVVTVSREIAAPVSVVRDCCWYAARHGVIPVVGIGRLSGEAVRATIALGPIHHDFRAAVAGGPGVLRWRGPTSGGVIRLVPLDAERTRVDVTLTWTPQAPWAHAAAATGLDRREIAAALARVATMAESEAADSRLGAFAV